MPENNGLTVGELNASLHAFKRALRAQAKASGQPLDWPEPFDDEDENGQEGRCVELRGNFDFRVVLQHALTVAAAYRDDKKQQS